MLKTDVYWGLDIGSASTGIAVTDSSYNLIQVNGKDLWGVALYDMADTAKERREFRNSRRRVARKRNRLDYLKELFADVINKVDPGFYQRLEESSFFVEDRSAENKQKYSLFNDKDYTDKEFYEENQTVFHLREKLIKECEKEFDVRLVFLGIYSLFKHRGHFYNYTLDPDSENLTNIEAPYNALCELAEEFNIEMPAYTAIQKQLGEISTGKRKDIKDKLYNELNLSERKNKSQAALIKSFLGYSIKITDVFGKDVIGEDNEKLKICFQNANYEEKREEIIGIIGNHYFELIDAAKEIYDINCVANLLQGEQYLSVARKKEYDKHHDDLVILKNVIKNFSQTDYNYMFRCMTNDNYSNYVKNKRRKSKDAKEKDSPYKKLCNKIEEMLKSYQTSVIYQEYKQDIEYILNEIELERFLPKQMTANNGVIPNQLHARELKVILDNAAKHLSFLNDTDESGLTVKERIYQCYTFCVPYYVGPLGENSKTGWVIKKEDGIIYPWNLEEKIDMGKTAENFIMRMVRKCTYLTENPSLPKESLLYEKYMVLNELNKLRINGFPMTVEVKKLIYTTLFKNRNTVTLKQVLRLLQEKNILSNSDTESCITGLADDKFHASLTSYQKAKRLFEKEELSEEEEEVMEYIIYLKTLYKRNFKLVEENLMEYLEKNKNLPKLDEQAMKIIQTFDFKDWGNLSREFLEMKGSSKDGQNRTIIESLWETNDNLMQLLGNEKYTYSEELSKKVKNEPKELKKWTYKDLDNYCFSAPIKRSVWRTMKLMVEIEKATGRKPTRIFVEMPRGEDEKSDNESRKSRLGKVYKNLIKEFKDSKDEKIQERLSCAENLLDDLEKCDESALRQKKRYLYFTQMGKDIYTGETIDYKQVTANTLYDKDHIYPQCLTTDDSPNNNLVLVSKKINNNTKGSNYPLPQKIQKAMSEEWKFLADHGFITKEKYSRLIRTTKLTDQEKADFINRQLIETRQSTKAITKILQLAYPEAEIIFSKARAVSDFRKDYNYPKTRSVNPFHHAKDAYLNIVVGNTYYTKFTKNPLNFVKLMSNSSSDKYHMRKIFDHDVKHGENEIAWDETRREIVKNTMAKDTPMITNKPYINNSKIVQKDGICSSSVAKNDGGYFPLKTKNSPLSNCERYGGKKGCATAGYVLVDYKVKGKTVRSLEPIPMYLGDLNKMKDKKIIEYLKKSLTEEYKGKEVQNITIKLKPIRFNSLVKINGYYYYIAGKTGKGINLRNATPLYIDMQHEKYIHKIEKAVKTDYYDETERVSQEENKEENGEPSEQGSTKEEKREKVLKPDKNLELFKILVAKLNTFPYKLRKNNLYETLKGAEKEKLFSELEIKDQCTLLINILNYFKITPSSVNTANLELLRGKKNAGSCKVSKRLHGLNEFILINQSISGLYEKKIDLLSL